MISKSAIDAYGKWDDNEDYIRWSKKIFDSIIVGILVVDVETKIIVDVNFAASVMIGSKKEDIIGNICSKCCCLLKNGKCPLDGTDVIMDIENEECVLLRKDGSELDVLVTITSALKNNRRFLIENFVDVSNFVGSGKEWEKAEKLLHDNILRIRNVKNQHDEDIVDQGLMRELYKALHR